MGMGTSDVNVVARMWQADIPDLDHGNTTIAGAKISVFDHGLLYGDGVFELFAYTMAGSLS